MLPLIFTPGCTPRWITEAQPGCCQLGSNCAEQEVGAEGSLPFMVSSLVSSQPRGQPPAPSTIQPLASLQMTIFAFLMFL